MQYDKIIEDEREIVRIVWDNEEAAEVGGLVGASDHRKITRIESYGEPAQYCNVPWFAVYVGDEIAMRVPAGQVSVQYAPGPKEGSVK